MFLNLNLNNIASKLQDDLGKFDELGLFNLDGLQEELEGQKGQSEAENSTNEDKNDRNENKIILEKKDSPVKVTMKDPNESSYSFFNLDGLQEELEGQRGRSEAENTNEDNNDRNENKIILEKKHSPVKINTKDPNESSYSSPLRNNAQVISASPANEDHSKSSNVFDHTFRHTTTSSSLSNQPIATKVNKILTEEEKSYLANIEKQVTESTVRLGKNDKSVYDSEFSNAKSNTLSIENNHDKKDLDSSMLDGNELNFWGLNSGKKSYENSAVNKYCREYDEEKTASRRTSIFDDDEDEDEDEEDDPILASIRGCSTNKPKFKNFMDLSDTRNPAPLHNNDDDNDNNNDAPLLNDNDNNNSSNNSSNNNSFGNMLGWNNTNLSNYIPKGYTDKASEFFTESSKNVAGKVSELTNNFKRGSVDGVTKENTYVNNNNTNNSSKNGKFSDNNNVVSLNADDLLSPADRQRMAAFSLSAPPSTSTILINRITKYIQKLNRAYISGFLIVISTFFLWQKGYLT